MKTNKDGANKVKPLRPGESRIAVRSEQVCILLCDHPRRFILGSEFDTFGDFQQVKVGGVDVIVLRYAVIFRSKKRVQPYIGWIDGREEALLKSLVRAPELRVILIEPDGSEFAENMADNELQRVANLTLSLISSRGEKAEWTPSQFAQARAVIETQFPPPAEWFK